MLQLCVYLCVPVTKTSAHRLATWICKALWLLQVSCVFDKASQQWSGFDAFVMNRVSFSIASSITKIWYSKLVMRTGMRTGSCASCLIQGTLRGRSSSPDQIKLEQLDDRMLLEAAKQTDGFSGRELAKLVASMQAAVYGSAQPVLTKDTWQRVINMKVREHEQRQDFLAGQQIATEKTEL